jgi:hypothetical protein
VITIDTIQMIEIKIDTIQMIEIKIDTIQMIEIRTIGIINTMRIRIMVK